MPCPQDSSLRRREQGQIFAGWIVGIFIIAAMVVYVADTMRRSRNATQSAVYRELALNIAKAGFEDGLSFFRTHTTGCYLVGVDSNAPTSQMMVTPWPDYPDAAFQPGPLDTDFYSSISIAATSSITTSANIAAGIIRDFSMNEYVTYTGSVQMQGSSLWGRYVIRRQNVPDWSPGPDTATVNTDPDACHDLSAIAAQSSLGSGTRWSIASHGYLLHLPSPVTSTAFSGTVLGNTAAFNGHCLLSAPLAFYNNTPFLLAQARVYGELSRLNFNFPQAAIQISDIHSITVNTNGIVNGLGASPQCAAYGAANTGSSWDIGSGTVNPASVSVAAQWKPSIAECFPGQTLASLQQLCQGLGTSGAIYGIAGNASVLPVFAPTTQSYISQVSQPTFYYLNTTITLQASNGAVPVLAGVGLVYVNGGLYIPAGNNSSWSGVVYVAGNCTLDGPTNISGILVVQGTLSVGNSADLNKTTIAYDSGAVQNVASLLQEFTVDSSSIITTQF